MRVIIIGAGAAGLACVAKLLELGFPRENFLVLEAENRIGGRVYTHPLGQSVIEIGAQWVHGEKENCVFQMGREAGELISESNYQSSGLSDDVEVVDWHGKRVAPTLWQRFREVMNVIDDKSMEELKSWQLSLGDYFEQEFAKHMKTDLSNEEPLLCRAMLEWYHKLENCIDGADSWFQTAGKGHTEYWECFGDPLVMWKRGYCSLFDILTKNLPKCENGLAFPLADRILLNKEVCSVQWDNGTNKSVSKINVGAMSLGTVKLNRYFGSFTVSKDKIRGARNHKLSNDAFAWIKLFAIGLYPDTNRESSRKLLCITIKCSDGSKYEADVAVISVSLGVLKSNHLAWFQPSLPAPKVKAIEHLAFGTVDKIFLEFEKPWWNEACGGFSFLQVPGKTQVHWSETILGFYTVRNQPNLLIGWATGVGAREMERESEDTVLKSCYDVLHEKLGQRFKISKPVKIYRSTWHKNKNFRGSYSFRSMDSDRYGVTAACLAKPVLNSFGVQVLHFAGEATHDHYYSTVHGAVESGYREACEIVKTLQSKLAKL